MQQRPNLLQRLGSCAGVMVVLAVAACYGTLALVALLSFVGIGMQLHRGAWATVIVVLVWLAVLGMGVNLKRYINFGPFLLADLGALLVSWVMLVEYNRAMEGGGFLLLMVAAFWDRHLRKHAPAAPPQA